MTKVRVLVLNKGKGKEKVWNLSPDNLEALKRSSNKFNVLQNEYSAEFPTLISHQKHWSDEMKTYLKEKWKEVTTEEIIGSNENQKTVVEDVFDDYSDMSNFLTKNEVVNGSMNVLSEEGSEGFFNV